MDLNMLQFMHALYCASRVQFPASSVLFNSRARICMCRLEPNPCAKIGELQGRGYRDFGASPSLFPSISRWPSRASSE